MGETDPQHAALPIEVEVLSEDETDRGWDYSIRVVWSPDDSTEHTVHFSWMDHDALTGGAASPSSVIEKAARIGAEHFGRDTLPERFDISTLNRSIPGFGGYFSRPIG